MSYNNNHACTCHTLHTGSNRKLGLVHKQKDVFRQVNILVNIMSVGTSNSHITQGPKGGVPGALEP